jgi:predicted NAD/FAD-dependent oxidoreductase
MPFALAGEPAHGISGSNARWVVLGAHVCTRHSTNNTATYGAMQLHNQEEHFLDAVQHWALSLLS